MLTIETVLDIALIGLLAVTLFHALRLERALGVLKQDRAALEQMIAAFNNSTRQAEAGIERLRGAADGAGRAIARHLDDARALKDDLTFLMERGTKLADRVDALVRAGRSLTAEPARHIPAQQVPAQHVPAQHVIAASSESSTPRSQAERDLLKALRIAR